MDINKSFARALPTYGVRDVLLAFIAGESARCPSLRSIAIGEHNCYLLGEKGDILASRRGTPYPEYIARVRGERLLKNHVRYINKEHASPERFIMLLAGNKDERPALAKLLGTTEAYFIKALAQSVSATRMDFLRGLSLYEGTHLKLAHSNRYWDHHSKPFGLSQREFYQLNFYCPKWICEQVLPRLVQGGWIEAGDNEPVTDQTRWHLTDDGHELVGHLQERCAYYRWQQRDFLQGPEGRFFEERVRA